MIRKDADLNTTIANIKGCLNKIGIETYIVSANSNNSLWFSVRLEVKDMYGIGANGKGVTYEAALASAYGELMERLESGFLLDKLFPTRRQYNYNNCYTEFYECLDNKKETLNYSDIDITCGSNGLAAGNTYEECFVQASCEILERFMMREIYFNNDTRLKIREIERQCYYNKECYTYIAEIEKKGYSVRILDCTLESQFPVIGVILEHKKTGKYCFSLGADFDFDICVERCITEIFQGKNFDIVFRQNMTSYYDILQEEDVTKGFIKSFLTGTGSLPLEILNIDRKIEKISCIFDLGKSSNVDLAAYIVDIFKKLKCKIYVKDYAWLGFPCLRVYIPKLSQIVMQKLSEIEYRRKFSISINELIGKKEKNFNIIDVYMENRYKFFDLSINSILGIVLKHDEEDYRWLYDTDLFFAMISFLDNNYDCAINILQNEQNEYKSELCAINVFRYLKEKTIDYVSNEFIKSQTNNWIKKANKFREFSCCECSLCELKELCSYELWKKIDIKSSVYKEAFNENYSWLRRLV